jgi:hypothetical protein
VKRTSINFCVFALSLSLSQSPPSLSVFIIGYITLKFQTLKKCLEKIKHNSTLCIFPFSTSSFHSRPQSTLYQSMRNSPPSPLYVFTVLFAAIFASTAISQSWCLFFWDAIFLSSSVWKLFDWNLRFLLKIPWLKLKIVWWWCNQF